MNTEKCKGGLMGRNKEVNEKVKEERRQKILAGALELFSLNGAPGTKISDIARHTGMSNGLVYHYFASKEEIYTELIRTALDRLEQACRHLAALPLLPHEKIKYAIDELVKTIRTNPDAGRYHLFVTQAIAAKNIPKEAAQILDAKRRIPYEVMAQIMEKGQQLGTVRPGRSEDLSFFFWVNINGMAQHQVMYGKTARQPPLELLYHMFLIERNSTDV